MSTGTLVETPRTRAGARAAATTRRTNVRPTAPQGTGAGADTDSPGGTAPFVLLIMVLLTAGLVTTLWLSTAAAADSYRLDSARQVARDLSEQSERLHRDVEAAQSAPALAAAARAQGMVPAGDPAVLLVAPDGSSQVIGNPQPAHAPVAPAPAAAPITPAAPDDPRPRPREPDRADPGRPGRAGRQQRLPGPRAGGCRGRRGPAHRRDHAGDGRLMARSAATMSRPPSRAPQERPPGGRRLPPPPPRTPRRPAPRPPDPRRRLRIGRVLLVVLLLMATAKLVEVQGLRAGELSEDAARQRTTRLAVPAERGAILDRNGVPLAFSVEAKALVANPRRITADWNEPAVRAQPGAPTPEQRKSAIALGMGRLLNTDPGPIFAALSSDRSYVVLAPLVDPAAARAVRDAFPEIAEEDRESRQYPAGEVAANVVGSASWNMDRRKIRGAIGLESALDDTLAGTDGFRVVDTAEGSDAVIPGTTRAEQPAQAGRDVVLSLDTDLQYAVEQRLSEYTARVGARNGSAVVLDAHTGQVLSMANSGSFNPAAPGAPGAQLGNPSVTSPFEPGSVNKIVTMAGALEAGLIRPEDVITVPGSIRIADRTVNDAWSHGDIRMSLNGVLGRSSNVGTLMTAQRLGPDRFATMLSALGIGSRTGIELPGESAGSVPAREDWSGSTFGNLPIGQGLSMTTLQMASMYQAVANDGVRVPPRMIEAEVGADGVRVPTPAPEGVRAMSPQTASTLRDMLQSVIQDGRGANRGTGPAAALPGYAVAGKTGTAQQVDPGCGCYSSSNYWITFAGMFPAQDPRYVVAIMLDRPPGGDSAAPLFHDIGTYLAQHGAVPVSTAPPRMVPLTLP